MQATSTPRDTAVSSPMASRPGSPASHSTPKSKIKAMLAAIDDADSDEELVRAAGKGDRAAITPVKAADATVVETQVLSDKSDGEEDIVPVPRGRVARRLQATKTDGEDGEEDAGNAYERVQKLLSKGKHQQLLDQDAKTADAAEREESRVHMHATPVPRPSSPLDADVLDRSVPPPPVEACSKPSSRHESPDSDQELPPADPSNTRFRALVAQKRKAREAKEAEEARQRNERYDQLQSIHSPSDDEAMSGDDSIVEQQLTQSTRPARKASKKALEEMNRETQRLSRNMQLAHEARTKKKITKQSLFDRFNFRPANAPLKEEERPAAADSSASSQPASSPSRAGQVHSTAPTSADPSVSVDTVMDTAAPAASAAAKMEDVFARLRKEAAAAMRNATTNANADKGTGKAVETEAGERKPTATVPVKKTYRIRAPPKAHADTAADSDSELEILPAAESKTEPTVWERVKPQEREASSLAMLKLRALSGLTAAEAPSAREHGTISRVELSENLRRRARQQAAQEREERIKELRSRGIEVHSAEERAKQDAEVTDLVQKARDEADEIMNKEKAAAKREKLRNGAVDALEIDSEEDEDWMDEGGDDELSGSGEEQDEDDRGSEEVSGLVETEAAVESDDGTAPDALQLTDDSEAEEEQVTLAKPRTGRNTRVISDDEDAEDAEPDETPNRPTIRSDASVLRSLSAKKMHIPGLPTSHAVPIGLTQIFAGTMESQSAGLSGITQEQDSLELLRGLPVPTLPEWESPEVIRNSQQDLMEDLPSQGQDGITLDYTQSQTQQTTTAMTATQASQMPEPTQDLGFSRSSPLPVRFGDAPPSTMDTVVVDRAEDARDESPIVKQRRRLRRRAEVYAFSDEEAEADADLDKDDAGDFEISADAFGVMKSAVRRSKAARARADFDKKRSEAKGMVHEQAEESEDEYAGLGGVSDDESGNEEDVQAMKEMLDDHTPQEVDEGQLAALYADKEREQDTKQVEKLFKDISRGMLRRKRGADYDLSDSDDDGEARKRRRRREFARMRKALLEDENIGKIATNPKKQAFLAAIEDRADAAEEVDFLDGPVDASPSLLESQSPWQSQQQAGRKSSVDDSTVKDENRRPAHVKGRPVARTKKPTTGAEIRASLLELMDAPNAMCRPHAATDEDGPSSSDNDEAPAPDADRAAMPAPRVPASHTTHPRRTASEKVIDRRLLLRTSSTNTGGRHLAFQSTTTTATSAWGRGPPALLLRRATTGHLISAGSGEIAPTERQAGLTAKMMADREGSEAVVKRGGAAKTSAINACGVKRRRGFGGGVGEDDEEEEERKRMLARRRKRVDQARGVGVGREGSGGLVALVSGERG